MAPSAALALLPTHRAEGTRRRAIPSQGHTLPLASLPTCVPACLLTTCMHAISTAHTHAHAPCSRTRTCTCACTTSEPPLWGAGSGAAGGKGRHAWRDGTPHPRRSELIIHPSGRTGGLRSFALEDGRPESPMQRAGVIFRGGHHCRLSPHHARASQHLAGKGSGGSVFLQRLSQIDGAACGSGGTGQPRERSASLHRLLHGP